MDLLFTEYASPYLLLDGVIAQGQLCDFLEVFDERMEEKKMWEFYIHKLPPWDERTYDQFRREMKQGRPQIKKIERPSDEVLEATVKQSYEMMKNFEITQEGG